MPLSLNTLQNFSKLVVLLPILVFFLDSYVNTFEGIFKNSSDNCFEIRMNQSKDFHLL